MLNTNDILETIRMIADENLDVRTVTMGISLLDCADADPKKACEKIYQKITTRAKDLVKTANEISDTYGMPIVNKRISVTPIAPWNMPKHWTRRLRLWVWTSWVVFPRWYTKDFRRAISA